MMSAPFFPRNFRDGQNRPNGGQGQDHNSFPTTNAVAGAHGEPLYYQMSRMNNAGVAASSAAAFAAQQQHTLPFFSNAQLQGSNAHYGTGMTGGTNTGAAPKMDYSDEMMRHLLLSANSINPSTSHQGQSLASSSPMRGPLQPAQQSSTAFANAVTVKQEEKGLLHGVLAGGTGKGKGRKGKKDLAPGEKPIRKKKRRAFEFYWEELRSEYAKTHHHLGHNERRAVAQQEWKNVNDRDKWQKMADEYNEKMLDEKYKHRPKPPVTANAFFFKEQHVLLRQQRPELKGGAVLSEISKMWEKCTDRQRWIDMQAADRRRYETEMANYKATQPI